MFEICAFVNIRRAPRTAWTTLLSSKVGSDYEYTSFQLFSGIRPDGSEMFSVRSTNVTGAGGVADSTDFANKFDALDAYNEMAGVNVSVAK